MSTLYFSKEHEWISVDGAIGTIGITDYAQQALGDIVFVELPEVGTALVKGGDAAVVESVKAASDVYAPVSGAVIEVNEALVDQPALVNESPEDAAWFLKIELSDKGELAELMDRAAYDAFVASLEE
ncbi:MAG: glycine cleavage system protein GcvH [Rhodospirillaceae bacterium]|nr:glycine cleavage system protein GcvH [Rhodospirillaceae bacterium]